MNFRGRYYKTLPIKLLEILELPTIYLYDDIHLYEANSGFVDHPLHKKIEDKIVDGWVQILNSIPTKNAPLYKLPNEELKLAIDTGIKFEIATDREGFKSVITIELLLAIFETPDFHAIKGAAISQSNPIEVYLKINGNFTVTDILNDMEGIREMAGHEAVHIIKSQHKKHQLSFKNDHEFTQNDAKQWYKYHINSDEFHAYIAQLNNELEHIRSRNPKISLANALKHAKIWKRYTTTIFKKSSGLRNKMLSKIAHHWNNS